MRINSEMVRIESISNELGFPVYSVRMNDGRMQIIWSEIYHFGLMFEFYATVGLREKAGMLRHYKYIYD